MHSDGGSDTQPPKASSTKLPVKLESPSEALILLRKQVLVEKLMKEKVPTPHEGDPASGVRKTVKVGPSSILSRVKEFIPMIKTENEKLRLQVEENPSAVSIENNDEAKSSTEPMVEVNLAFISQQEMEDDSDDSSDSIVDDRSGHDQVSSRRRTHEKYDNEGACDESPSSRKKDAEEKKLVKLIEEIDKDKKNQES